MERKRLSSRRSNRKKGFQPLNLIPIMNLFITVIPMLLMITVTVHMTLLSLNLVADSGGGGGGEGEGGGGGGETETIKIQLVIYPDRFELIEGTRAPLPLEKEVNSEGEEIYNFFTLNEALKECKERNPEVGLINVVPFDEVLYDTLARAIDVCKYVGFMEIGYERPKVSAV